MAATVSRHLADGGGRGGDAQAALDSYLADLARNVKRRGWTMDGQRCVFCNGASRLRTGTLSHLGPVLFCPQCEPAYRLLRGEEADDTRKVHWADAEGTSACGIGWRVTTDAGQVTCLRCQLYVRQRAPALIRFVRSLL